MREFCIENQGTNTYLVYTFSEDDMVDTMSLGMLTNNHIQGVTETTFYQMDAVKQVKYNITSKVEIQQMFERTLNRKQVLGIFSGIVNALLEVEEYMLEPSSIVLDKKYIFADVSTYETTVICVPVMESQAQNVNLGMFFKELVFTAQFDPTENCDYVTKIINFLNSSPAFSLLKFKQLLDELKFPVADKKTVTAEKETPKKSVQSAQNEGYRRQSEQRMPERKAPVQTESKVPVQTSPKVPDASANMAVPQKTGGKTAAGMQIPGSAPAKMQTDPVKTQNEKQMSRLYLLQHYSKENAAIYKAQQAEKKNAKGGKAKKGNKQEEQQVSYVVPGADKLQAARQNAQSPVQQPQGMPERSVQQQPQGMPERPVQQQPQRMPERPAQQPMNPQNPIQQAFHQGVQQPANFGATTVLNANMNAETSVLSGPEAQKQQPYLFRMKNNERIMLNKLVFRIGKERSYVDYFVSDNAAVSRSHANIVEQNGKFYVVDTNSTNHTYVNGRMIQSNTEVLLSHGDRVRLANEEFEFHMM